MNRIVKTVATVCVSSILTTTAVSSAHAAPTSPEPRTAACASVDTSRAGATGRTNPTELTVADVNRFIRTLPASEQAELRALEAELARAKAPSGQQQVVPAAVVAAAAVCASGAVSGVGWGVASQALAKLINWNGESAFPTGAEHLGNAIVGCLTGGLGGVVWKFLPASVKARAVGAVVGIIMKMHR